ncbi:MAG: hypothetical protein IKS31_01475 [Clostridia bacterium]|nr:hypothetical protein [Clostridia bacterium]
MDAIAGLTMMKPDGKTGTWIKCTDRQPPKYGRYQIIKRGRSRHYDYDEYLWNGGGWVTHGHSLSNAVEYWFEEENG